MRVRWKETGRHSIRDVPASKDCRNFRAFHLKSDTKQLQSSLGAPLIENHRITGHLAELPGAVLELPRAQRSLLLPLPAAPPPHLPLAFRQPDNTNGISHHVLGYNLKSFLSMALMQRAPSSYSNSARLPHLAG